MSLPLFLAAKILRLDIYLIEPNQILGRANKFFFKFLQKDILLFILLKIFLKNLKIK